MRLLKAFWDWLRGKTDKEQIKELKDKIDRLIERQK